MVAILFIANPFYISPKVIKQSFNFLKAIRFFPPDNMPMVSFAVLIVVSNKAISVFAKIEPVFVTVE